MFIPIIIELGALKLNFFSHLVCRTLHTHCVECLSRLCEHTKSFDTLLNYRTHLSLLYVAWNGYKIMGSVLKSFAYVVNHRKQKPTE